MAKVTTAEVAEALGITNQQYEIIRIVNSIRNMGGAPTPVNIEQSYFEHSGKAIASSNLFRQLAQLKKRGFIGKNTKSEYLVEFDTIEASLLQDVERLDARRQALESIANNIRVFLGSEGHSDDDVKISYLNYKELFASITKSMKKATGYYITAKFPGVAYTYGPYAKIGRGQYMDVMNRRALDERAMDITYLTALDEEYPLAHAHLLHSDKKLVQTELKLIREKLETVINHPNIHIYRSKNPYGVDIVIPTGPDLKEVYFFIRNEEFEVVSGIKVVNKQITDNHLIAFKALCNQAELLKPKKMKKG